MKNIKLALKSIVVIFISSMVFISCTDNFDALNTNPSLITPDVMDADMLFTKVQKNSVFWTYSYDRVNEWAGYVENQGTSVVTDRDWPNPLISHSVNYIKPLNESMRLWEREPLNANKIEIGRIMRVWIFHHITDAYGDVPYSQVGLDIENAVNFPEYEEQESIYRDMLNELREASANLSDNPELFNLESADLIFSGDVELWRRFANSLRFRLAMRVRYADEQLAAEHINEVINLPLMETRDHMAYILTEGANADDTSNRNPEYNRAINVEIPAYGNFTIAEVLQLRDDPRLPIYLNPAPEPADGDVWRARATNVDPEDHAEYEGQWTGFYAREHNATLGDHFKEAEYEIKILHAPEVYFLRAEAALFNLTGEDAEMMHREGVRLALEMYDVESSEIDAYMESDAARLNGTQEENFKEIIVQKYISNYWLAYESWAEHRRTGYPLIWVGTRGNITAEEDRAAPRRLPYPVDEYFKNQANVEAAVSRLERGDNYRSRVWWDQKPGLPIQHPRQHTFPPNRDWVD